MSILAVEKSGRGLEAAVLRDGRLYAYESDFSAQRIAEGQIWAGTVDRAMKGVNAVFVRLENKEFGFLPIPQGEKPPASGERMIVQVKRPPNQSKRALLSREITLAATYLVYLPQGAGVHVSSRVQSEADKESLKQIGLQLRVETGGIILRSAAQHAALGQLVSELSALTDAWRQITEDFSHASGLLWRGADGISRLLREESGRLESIVTNAPELFLQAPVCPVKACEQPFALYSVRAKLEKSLRRTVLLKSGATLVIDPCEAMTVIDVNSAMASGGGSLEETAEKINLEAAKEAARLMRLRNMGGMILVDFIDMKSPAARDRLLSAMREELLSDPVKAVALDITALGIMEITRHRDRAQASPLPDLPCPHCCGTGIHFSKEEDDADA